MYSGDEIYSDEITSGPLEEERATYELPAWASRAHDPTPAACRSCGAGIAWVISRTSGKRAPINPDGTSHFATCPEAASWRRPR